MPKQLMKLRPRGVIKDRNPIDITEDTYTDASNMVVRNEYMQRIGGLEDVFGAAVAPPVWLLPVLTDTVAFWLYATEAAGVDGLGVTDGAVHNDITPVALIDTNGRFNAWTGGLLNGVPIINPGFSEPVFWDLSPGTPTTILPGWPAGDSCGALRPHRNFLFAMDYTESGGTHIESQIRWSDSADPGFLPSEWQPLPSNDAGDLSLGETPGPVIDGLTLKSSFICYKQSSVFAIDFVGGQFIYGGRLLFSTVGVLSRNCVVEFRGNHAVLTDGDFVVHDGNQVTSVIDEQMRRHLFNNISGDNFERAFLAHYKPRSEIWICYPRGTSLFADEAIVWNYEDNKFGIRDLYQTPHAANGIIPNAAAGSTAWDGQPATWDTSSTSWGQTNFNPSADKLILADQVDDFLLVDAGTQKVDIDITALVERDSLDFGDAELVKTVRTVWPRIEGTPGDTILVAIGSQMNQNDPIDFSSTQNFVIGTDRKIDSFATGRLISVRMGSIGGAIWRTSGFDIEFASTSEY